MSKKRTVSRLIGLGILVFILLASTQVVSAACCMPPAPSEGQPTDFFCEEAGDGFDIQNEQQCEDLGWSWSEQNCQVIADCRIGCCCQEGQDGIEVSEYICTALGDTTFFPGRHSNCAQMCAESIFPYTLSGLVLDEQNNVVETASVSILYEGESLGTTTTDPQGMYSLNIISSQEDITVVIRAEKDLCHGSITRELTEDDMSGLDILLDTCEETPEPAVCVPPVWSCDWDAPFERACGIPSNCVNTNPPGEDETQCATPRQPDTQPIIPVPCSFISTCGNGLIEPGEECDCGSDWWDCTSEQLNSMTCESFNMVPTTTGLSCNSECRYDYSGCSMCPEGTVSSCTIEQCLMGCDACEGLCDQYQTCEDFEPQLELVQAVAQSPFAQITWNMGDNQFCLQNTQRIFIERCRVNDDNECITNSYINTSFSRPQAGFLTIQEHTDTNPLLASGSLPRNRYCYDVYAIVNIGGVESKFKTNERMCLDTGDAACMQSHEAELCSNTESIITPPDDLQGPHFRSYCDENNMLRLLDATHALNTQGPFDCSVDENGNDVPCMGPYVAEGGITRCGRSDLCTLCNGLFSMYHYLGSMRIPVYGEQSVSFEACNGFANQCYEHKELTVTDQLETCGNLRSCYDYHNKDECLSNSCGSVSENCEWEELRSLGEGNDMSVGEELGLGMCRPQEPEAQDCQRCQEDDHLSPSCTKELCNLYGESCFYVSKRLSDVFPLDMVGACYNAETLGCAFYSTQEECEGDQAVRVDAQYAGMNRIGGTHELIPSLDELDFGTCQWVSSRNYCIKNADNYTGVNNEDDCQTVQPLSERLRCIADNNPPITSIITREPRDGNAYPVYGPREENSYDVEVQDQYEQGDLITGNIKSWFSLTPTSSYYELMTSFPVDDFSEQETRYSTGTQACQATTGTCAGEFCYACGDGQWTCLENKEAFCNNPLSLFIFSEEGSPGEGIPIGLDPMAPFYLSSCSWKVRCNPDSNAQNYPNKNIEEIQTLNVPSADYELRYYSEDLSKNLEEIQHIPITIDSTPPQLVNYHMTNNSYELHEDVWRTDLTFTYDVQEDNGYARCQGRLTRISNGMGEFSGDIDAIGTGFEQEYQYLADDMYMWSLRCVDIFNNEATYKKRIHINADRSITVIEPVLGVFNVTTIELEIESGAHATCHYDEQNIRPVSSNAEEFYSEDGYTHTATITVDDINTIHTVYTGCRFTENGRVVEGDAGDIIIFSVDHAEPSTTVRRTSGEEYLANSWTDSEELVFECSDYHDNLIIPAEGTYIPMYFGALHVEYCLSTSEQRDSGDCNQAIWNGLPLIITKETVDDYGDYLHLHYSCTDKGMNTEAWKHTRILVRDTEFQRPRIQICDPLTGTCRPAGE